MSMAYDRVDWSDERIELLKKFWADGLSASQIAGQIPGASRNAIIGKVHRLGLARRHSTAPSVTMRVRKPRQANGHHHVGAVHKIARKRFDHVDPAEQITDLPSDQSDCAVAFMEAGLNCRWPLGEPTHDMMVCGAKPYEGLPYCARHCRLAYQPRGGA